MAKNLEDNMMISENPMNNENKIEAYNMLVDIEKQVSDLHNTLDYWIQRLLDNIDWEEDE